MNLIERVLVACAASRFMGYLDDLEASGLGLEGYPPGEDVLSAMQFLADRGLGIDVGGAVVPMTPLEEAANKALVVAWWTGKGGQA